MLLFPNAFEQTAQQRPEAIALKSGARSLSYAALNALANRIAWLITQAAGEANEPAYLLITPGLSQFVALLAAIKARKIYVALDVSRPELDLRNIVQDAGGRIFLTDARYLTQVQDIAPASSFIFNLDDLPAAPETNLNLNIAPDDLAVIRYTSGSTGVPRGAPKSHKSVLAGVVERDDVLIFPSDRMVVLTSLSFSLGFNDMCAALVTGATLLPCDFRANGPRACANFLHEERITCGSMSPTMLRQLLDALAPGELFPDLRYIRTGGEALLPADLERVWPHLSPSAVIFNLFGSTEAGTVTTSQYRPGQHLREESVLRIGKPCGKSRIVLEKENGEKAAVGEEGEIIAVSPHVSTCYWRKPELTAARFFVDAATGYNGFRTGDVGRWLEDGSIEWLGRKDSMVKIRGQKVILGEVEAALRHAPNIKEGAVALRRDPADDDRVVAYAVPALPPLDVEHLNTWLMERLPAQALPTAYVELAALPINRNGKIDLPKLPAPDWGKRALAAPAAAPRDALERKIVDIWREVLRLRELGADDNLFALGAHSISAARALARMENECGAKLPLSALVQANTPARLAQRIRQGAPAPASRPIIPLKPAGSKPPLFFVHVLGGGVMNYLPMAQALDPDQPFYAFQAAGFDGECDPHRSIPQMAAHYVAALRQFQPRGPYHLGGHCFGGVVAFEMARQLEAAGEQVASVDLIDAHAPGKPPRSESLAHPLAFAKNARLWWKANGAGYAAKRLRVAARRNAHRALGDADLRLDDVLVAPEAVPDDMVHLLKAQIAAHRAYRAAPIHAPINLYRVALQPLFRAHQKLNGWEKFTSGGVNLHVVQGDHRTVILDTACAHELARAVTRAHGM